MIKWQTGRYHPVVDLPNEYEVRDFTGGNYTPSRFEYDIGRYDELRPGMYSTDLFSDGRFLHIGIDIGAPVGTPCMAFDQGEISHFGYNPADGDYGYVVITKHLVDNMFGTSCTGTCPNSGTAEVEGSTIYWVKDASTEIITLTITDPNGNVTTMSVPLGDFEF